MSGYKLENIFLEYGIAVLNLTKNNDPIGKPVDEAVKKAKDLMLELMENVTKYSNPKQPAQMWVNEDELRQKVEEL